MDKKCKCVYLHKRKSDDLVFYVGMGSIDRAYSKYRNYIWMDFVKDNEYYVEIYKDNLTVDEAKSLERKLIREYSKSLTNILMYDGFPSKRQKRNREKIENKTLLFVRNEDGRIISKISYSKLLNEVLVSFKFMQALVNAISEEDITLMDKNQLAMYHNAVHFLKNVRQGYVGQKKCLIYETRYY